MTIVKSIETPQQRVWIEQHNDLFILKHQETGKNVQALNAIPNLTLVLEFFDRLVDKSLVN